MLFAREREGSLIASTFLAQILDDAEKKCAFSFAHTLAAAL